jgi:hypothetical protein
VLRGGGFYSPGRRQDQTCFASRTDGRPALASASNRFGVRSRSLAREPPKIA